MSVSENCKRFIGGADGNRSDKGDKTGIYVKQACQFFEYTPVVVDESHLLVKIPYEDAMRLRPGAVSLQCALTDADGNKQAAEIVQVDVKSFLKEAGYA